MGLMNQTETWHHSITLLLLKGHFGQNSITPAQCSVIYYITCIFSSFSSKQNTQKGFQDSSNRFFDFNVSTREQICTCSYAIGKICCYRIYAILRPGRRIQPIFRNCSCRLLLDDTAVQFWHTHHHKIKYYFNCHLLSTLESSLETTPENMSEC